MTLIEEFHSDHQKVVSTLVDLRTAIQSRDIARVRSLLGAAEGVVGPHFKFEELYLYPALERFIGEVYVEKLLNEHDGIFRSVGRLAQLAQKDSWSGDDHDSAMANLDLIYEHPIACDGLSLWMERLSAEMSGNLLQKMQGVREEGTKLSEYARERRTT